MATGSDLVLGRTLQPLTRAQVQRGGRILTAILAASAQVLAWAPPAVADRDEDELTFPLAPALEEQPVEAAPAAPAEPVAETPAQVAERLELGTRRAGLLPSIAPPSAEWLAEASVGATPQETILWPVEGANFGRGFGYTRVSRPELIHNGVDMNAPEGTPVVAAADGLVVYASDTIDGFGNFVVIVHPNGWTTAYAHNSEMFVEAGQHVHRGDRIALVGQTGLAHGPHVHFEMYAHGRPVDPAAYFEGGPPIVQRHAREAAFRRLRHTPRH